VAALVAWDVDDVLNDLTAEWLAWSRIAVPYESLARNPPHAQVGMTHAEYLASLDAFRRERYSSLAPNPKVQRWISQSSARVNHIVVTAVPSFAAPFSAGWVMRHFGERVRGFHFAPSSRPDDPQPRPDKSEILARFRDRAILVDDSVEHVERAGSRGMTAVLFPRPWNDAPDDVDATLDRLASLLHETDSR
jgi:hypothetical protein